MTTYTLVYVRATRVAPVPPVCSAFWTAGDWRRTERVHVESLVLDACGKTWTATGERDSAGELLYSCTR